MTDNNDDDNKPTDNSPDTEASEELSLYEKLKKETEEADWTMLEPHHVRQALIIVSKDLDLIEVGVKVAEDDVDAIKSWMTSGLIGKAEDAQVNNWKASPYKKGFKFIIIQPYVLVQEYSELKQ